MSTRLLRSSCLLLSCCLPSISNAGETPLVIENVRVIVGDVRVRQAACVVVHGDRIERVVEAMPEGMVGKRIDGRGKTLMPGLIDTHIHVFGGSFTGKRGFGEQALRAELANEVPERMMAYLRHGVTTVKSTGDALTLILELRELLKSGRLIGPRLLVAGPGFTAPGSHPAILLERDPWWRGQHTVEVDRPDEARTQVRRVAATGVDAIKLVYHGGPHPELYPDGIILKRTFQRRDAGDHRGGTSEPFARDRPHISRTGCHRGSSGRRRWPGAWCRSRCAHGWSAR